MKYVLCHGQLYGIRVRSFRKMMEDMTKCQGKPPSHYGRLIAEPLDISDFTDDDAEAQLIYMRRMGEIE